MAELLLLCQVLEPNWHVLRQKMQSSAKVDELMAHHNEFLDTSLKASRDIPEIYPRYTSEIPSPQVIALHRDFKMDRAEIHPRYTRDTISPGHRPPPRLQNGP